MGSRYSELVPLSIAEQSVRQYRRRGQRTQQIVRTRAAARRLKLSQPAMIQMVVNHPAFSKDRFATMRRILYGASPITEALLSRAAIALPSVEFMQCYGVTETASQCSVLHHAQLSPEDLKQGCHRSAGRATFGNPDANRLGARIDPEYEDEYARSAVHKYIRDERIAYINNKLADRPELIEKIIPKAPPLSSRPIRVDPDDNVYGALLRDNVTLVSDSIERATPAGIMAGGREYPLDIILYATGFRANDFLWPMEVRGKDGLRIETLWEKDGPRAYLGTMLPGSPISSWHMVPIRTTSAGSKSSNCWN